VTVKFQKTDILSRGDLDIFLTNNQGNPSNAAEASYAVYYVDSEPPNAEILIGTERRKPVNPSVGEYYASLQVPVSARPGTYRIRWTFKEFVSSQAQQIVQEWEVVEKGCIEITQFSPNQWSMIQKLRLLLRDQNPDKYARFRPPESESRIGSYNRVFGHLWEDEELYEYLERALDFWNMMPPETEELSTIDRLVDRKPVWRTAVLWGAITHAATALMSNWISEEFDYSIGGISLSLERSSKYESLKSSAEVQFDKATEAKARTTKIIRGLRQSRFGIGVRSAFGPHTGKGILSPRKFMGM
jgi:hypothetical protein